MKNEIEGELAMAKSQFNGKEKIHVFLDNKNNDQILLGKCIDF